jgi:hypothetical protein
VLFPFLSLRKRYRERPVGPTSILPRLVLRSLTVAPALVVAAAVVALEL